MTFPTKLVAKYSKRIKIIKSRIITDETIDEIPLIEKGKEYIALDIKTDKNMVLIKNEIETEWYPVELFTI